MAAGRKAFLARPTPCSPVMVPPRRDGLVEDLFHGGFDAVHFVGVVFVGEEGGVQVAVAHVAEGADAQAVALRRLPG